MKKQATTTCVDTRKSSPEPSPEPVISMLEDIETAPPASEEEEQEPVLEIPDEGPSGRLAMLVVSWTVTPMRRDHH